MPSWTAAGAASAIRAIGAFAAGVPILGAVIQALQARLVFIAGLFGTFAAGATIAAAGVYLLFRNTQQTIDQIERLTRQQTAVANFNQSFVSMRQELEAMGQTAASRNLMDFFTLDPDLYQRNLQAAQQYFSQVKTLNDQLLTKQRELAQLRTQLANQEAAAVRQAEIERQQWTIQSIQQILQERRQAYQKSLKLEQQYTEDAKKLRLELASVTRSTEQQVQEIRQRGMDEAEQQASLEREADLLAAQATLQALSLRTKLTDEEKKAAVEAAKANAQRAQSLAGQITDTEKAVRVTENAGRALQTALQEEINLTEEAKKAQAEKTKKLAEEYLNVDKVLQSAQKRLKELTEQDATIQIKADISAAEKSLAEIERKLADLRNGVTIPVRTSGGGEGGEPVTRARGGPIPGWGGGDRIHALLEAGEFVMRKEAVRKWGLGVMTALNGLRMPGGLSGGLPRFAAGGAVGGEMTLNITFGGQRFQLFGARDQVKGFSEALTRLAKGVA